MKYIMFLLLTACTTVVPVPVKRNFPDIPHSLETGCENLVLIPENITKLSELLTVIVQNYSLYHECKIKNESWADWYKTQKQIFEEIK